MKQVFLLILATFFSVNLISAQDTKSAEPVLNQNPEKAQIVTSDLALFWRAYDTAKAENNLIVYRDEYFKKGSVGLQEFLRSKIGNSCNLVTAIDAAPKYYASLRAQTAKVENYKPQMLASFKKLKEIYPDARFPNVYFLVGRMNAGGTVTYKGLLIGVELYGKTDDASIAELSGWKRASVGRIEEIPFIVAHELVHYQQKYGLDGELNLLGKSLHEGSADFIGELISGGNINQPLHEYGNPRERELWLEFKKEMNGTDTSNWLYQGDKAKDKPADLGYYIGYKIVESYYKKAKDKKQAIKDILDIKDFNHFLKASGYDEKFSIEKNKNKTMSKQIMIPFQVTLWDLKAYDEQTNEPTLSRGTVKKSFDTDYFKGESTGEILMYSSAADGSSAAYTVLDKFTVEIEGRKGSFVALHGATRSPAETSRALGKILPNSGTNDLKGISGTIEFVQNESGKKIILVYSFADEN